MFHNVFILPFSARVARETFLAGEGDVLLSFESEALTALRLGADIDYIIPDQTILVEHPIAPTTTTTFPDESQAFIDFLRSPEAQRVFADLGQRPILSDVAAEYAASFPTPPGLFTVTDLGGWDIDEKMFHPQRGIVASVQDRGD